jgi:hypothetical protein
MVKGKIMKSLKIEYEKEYGILKIGGWYIEEDGSFIVLAEKYLIIALIKWIVKRKNNGK